LGKPGTVAVVTGQQPAVGGGPLYSLVKTAHAIALAQALTAAGVPAVPVFWCASEDHDLGEAGHADVVLRSGDIRRVSTDLGRGRASLRHRSAQAGWKDVSEACRTAAGGLALGGAWWLAHEPRADESFGAWLCRIMADTFAEHGLVCVEGHRLRPLMRGTMERALAAWPSAELAQARARLLNAGRADAFGPLDHPPLFDDAPDGRVALDPAAARHLLITAPERLSPGAALRPVLQQAALPAAFYVAGPGELAYHRFIAPLYAACGVVRPRLVPRCHLTVVPGWIERACAAWGRTAEDAMVAVGGASSPGTADFQSAGDVLAAGNVLARLDSALAELASSVSAGDPDTTRRLTTGVQRLQRERDRLAASLARDEQRRAGRMPWGAVQAWLRPRGGYQERTMSLAQALWEYGPGIADTLVAAAAVTAPGEHRSVRLATS
jgi:uncharacterized protein YllA (UPF0747 family)